MFVFVIFFCFILTKFPFYQLPNQSQDAMLRIALTLLITYIAYVHVSLFAIFPALAALPSVVCLIVAHFLWKLAQHKADLERLKVSAQPVVSEKNEIDSDDYEISSESDNGVDVAFVDQRERGRENRRQSIVVGLQVLQAGLEQHEEQHEEQQQQPKQLELSSASSSLSLNNKGDEKDKTSRGSGAFSSLSLSNSLSKAFSETAFDDIV